MSDISNVGSMSTVQLVDLVELRPGSMDADVVSEMNRDEYYVKKYVRNGDVVIDVGAYIGAFALYVKDCCPGARVHCLEPILNNFLALQKNTKTTPGITIDQAAMGGTSGQINIYNFGLDASACHSIYDLGIDGAEAVSVQARTLSEVMRKNGFTHVRMLKLDCQGAEFEIIPMTPSTVLSQIDYISMEIHTAIAKTHVMLGHVPDSALKARTLHEHLLKTHTLIHGRIDESVQVWAANRLVPRVVRLYFLCAFRYRILLNDCVWQIRVIGRKLLGR